MADEQEKQMLKKQRKHENGGDDQTAQEEPVSTSLYNNYLFVEDATGQPPLLSTQHEILFSTVSGSNTSTTTAHIPHDPIICKFYVAGTCSYGNACRFSHIPRASKVISPGSIPLVISHSPQSASPNQVETALVKNSETKVYNNHNRQFSQPFAKPLCRFYGSLRGCKAGDSCPFLHKDEPKQSFLPSNGASEGGSILNKYSSVKIAERAGVEAIKRSGVNN